MQPPPFLPCILALLIDFNYSYPSEIRNGKTISIVGGANALCALSNRDAFDYTPAR